MLITKNNIDELAKEILKAHTSGSLRLRSSISFPYGAYILRRIIDGLPIYSLYIGGTELCDIFAEDFKLPIVPAPGKSLLPAYHFALLSGKIQQACLHELAGPIHESIVFFTEELHKTVGSQTDMVISNIPVHVYNVKINENRSQQFIDIHHNNTLFYSAPFDFKNSSNLDKSLGTIFKDKVLDGSIVMHIG